MNLLHFVLLISFWCGSAHAKKIPSARKNSENSPSSPSSPISSDPCSHALENILFQLWRFPDHRNANHRDFFDKALLQGRGTPYRRNLMSTTSVRTGSADWADGILGLHTIFSHESKLRPKLRNKLILAELYSNKMNRILLDQGGVGIQIDKNGISETFIIMDRGKFNRDTDFAFMAPRRLRNIFEDSRGFIREQYRKQHVAPEGKINELLTISRYESLENRSLTFGKVEEPILTLKDNEYIYYHEEDKAFVVPKGIEVHRSRVKPSFTLKGSMTIVHSAKKGEFLPMELYHEFKIPRKEGDHLVEMGRFSILKEENSKTSAQILQLVASTLAGDTRVNRIVANVDPVRKRVFEKLGFRELHAFRDEKGEIYDYILETTPETLLENALKKLQGFEL